MESTTLVTRYCSTRRDLEEYGWNLTSRLFMLTERLLRSIGNSHLEFASLKKECVDTRASIRQAHGNLRLHRSEHGC